MCLYPKLIENIKYKANKKNGGIIPTITDKRALYVAVKCNKCMECRKSKARDWTVRLQEEIKRNEKMTFVTLTFSNESIKEISNDIQLLTGYERDNEIAKIGTRRFLERWRKKHKKSVKHWLVTELGHNGTENIHMHGIIWSNKIEDIEKIWKYGYVWFGDYVNNRTINYIVKYVSKTDEKHPEYNSKILASPGIGNNYETSYNASRNKYNEKKTKEYYRTESGHKISLPIYYRNKIYNEEEREKLWMQKLDEEKRYVDGKEIDISNGEERYYKVLEEARKKGKRLGYGDDKINWERKIYENNRRNILHEKRTEKTNTTKIEPEEKITITTTYNATDDIWETRGASPQSSIF